MEYVLSQAKLPLALKYETKRHVSLIVSNWLRKSNNASVFRGSIIGVLAHLEHNKHLKQGFSPLPSLLIKKETPPRNPVC